MEFTEMTEGQRLRELRKSKGLTLEEFGNKLGVQKSAVSKMERGETKITRANLQQICRLFDVPEAWLLTGAGEMAVQRSRSEELTAFFDEISAADTSFKARLVSVLAQLSVEEWDLLEQMARKLAGEASTLTQEQEVEAQVEAYRRQLLSEKKMESQDSSPNAGGADGGSKLA